MIPGEDFNTGLVLINAPEQLEEDSKQAESDTEFFRCHPTFEDG